MVRFSGGWLPKTTNRQEVARSANRVSDKRYSVNNFSARVPLQYKRVFAERSTHLAANELVLETEDAAAAAEPAAPGSEFRATEE